MDIDRAGFDAEYGTHHHSARELRDWAENTAVEAIHSVTRHLPVKAQIAEPPF